MDFNERTKLLIDDSRLHFSCAAVFGLGGVGSYAAESLVRAGIGSIILIDSDTVSVSNINRQLLALHSTVGRKKTEAARDRYLDINPGLSVHTFDTFVLRENAGELFDSFPLVPDYVCDCIDTVSGKLGIISECTSRNIPLISSMGTGNKLHPEKFEITDIYKTSVCPLCRVMRKLLRENDIPRLDVLYSKEEPIKTGDTAIGSIPTVPSVAGLMISNHVIQKICK